MDQSRHEISRAPFFVLSASLFPALVVWMAVVKAIGYGMETGFLYFAAYFAAMILFLRSLGYTIFKVGDE